MVAVSFARDIRPLFTSMDIAHMKDLGVALDDYGYMRDPGHAQQVLDAVSTGVMPPRRSGEPPWSPESVQLFRDWIAAIPVLAEADRNGADGGAAGLAYLLIVLRGVRDRAARAAGQRRTAGTRRETVRRCQGRGGRGRING